MSTGSAYLVAGSRPWSRRAFDESLAQLPGSWRFVSAPEELTVELFETLQPRLAFFLHWSWKVPSEIVSRYECVAFHMTDVPYGRGGSPLQNLVAAGHGETKLTALRMVGDLDAGPIYLQAPLSLHGSAEEIYLRASRRAAAMAAELAARPVRPVPQRGEPVVFRRRTPEQSRIPATGSLEMLFDFIRMLDAEGYPHAFLEHEGFRYEFRRAALYDGRVEADVRIVKA